MDDYFLVTTADQRFWKKEENILFLGEWCKIHDQQDVWSGIKSKTLPYHWDNRQKLYEDWIYLQDVYEKKLVQLANKLNEIHDVTHSLRYWRIIIGPWLCCFIEILYDRYLSIEQAIKFGQVKNTWVPKFEQDQCIPNDFSTFTKWFTSDEYNLLLYSRIIETLKAFPLEIKKEPLNLKPFFHEGANFKLDNLKGMTKASLNFLWKFIPERFNKFFFSSSYLSPKSLIRLQVSLGQFPYISNPIVEVPETPVNLEWRNQIKLPKTGDRFDDLLNELIPMQIPKSFLERYSEMKNIALRVYPKKSKVILTGNALYVDEGFKLWTADQVEQGVKLVGIQHGGNYGTSRLSSFEKHEIDISDRYFSWGWRSKNENKVVALSGSKLIGIEKMISPDPRGYILWTCVFVPRYFYRMYSNPMGPQALEYVEDQRNFLNSTSKEVAKLIIMRAKPVEFGWQIKDRIKEWAHNVPLDWGDGSFYKKINGSRLVVVTGNATVLLEVLVANFPAILFWNPKYWEVRPEAEPYFNLLRQAGILYDTPEAAAKKINDIYINPMEWWLQPDVQKARALFCQQYAYLNEESWLQEWKAALIEISKLDK